MQKLETMFYKIFITVLGITGIGALLAAIVVVLSNAWDNRSKKVEPVIKDSHRDIFKGMI